MAITKEDLNKCNHREIECPECGHSNTHGLYGCEYERGDSWVTGNQAGEPTVLMAMGPCGCKYPLERDIALEEILEASRLAKITNGMLLSAFRKKSVL